MQHQDHVKLIRAGISARGGVWADLGSGSGAFTLALADLLGPGARIYSVDRDRRALREQEAAMRTRFPEVGVEYLEADFTGKLALPQLDGILMANSLHFVRDKAPCSLNCAPICASLPACCWSNTTRIAAICGCLIR